MTVIELRLEARGAIIQQMRDLVTRAADRSMTAEESAQWDALDLRQGRLAEQISASDPATPLAGAYVTDADGLAAVERELNERIPPLAGGRQDPVDDGQPREAACSGRATPCGPTCRRRGAPETPRSPASASATSCGAW